MYELEVIEPIINYMKVKYDKLEELILSSSMEGDSINIFINIDKILDLFYNDRILSAVYSLKSLEDIILTAELINLIAHYRHFFWKKFRAKSNFYLYHYNKKVKLATYYNKDYLKDVSNKRDLKHPKYGELNSLINDNLKLVDLISLYVKNAYYIESNGLEPSIIPYYIIKNKTKQSEANIILTSDKVEYQLANIKNTFILNCRGSKTKLISKKEIYDSYYKNIKYRPNNTISSKLYPVILSLIGYKKRNIDKVKGYSFVKSIKMIDKLIDNKIIKNKELKRLDYNIFKEYLSEEQFKQFELNFKYLNFKQIEQNLNVLDKILIDNKLEDRYDNIAIMDINADYFPNNNIKLIELCEGCDV